MMKIKDILIYSAIPFGVSIVSFIVGYITRKPPTCKADIVINDDPVYGTDMYLKINTSLEDLSDQNYIYCKVIRNEVKHDKNEHKNRQA